MRFISATTIHSGYSFLPKNAVLILDDAGTVLEVKPAADLDKTKIEFHEGILCPGMINSHCHLELSYMKGKIQEGKGLHEFIKEVEKLKKPADDELMQAIADSDKEMYRSGIVAVGDICNTNATFLFKQNSKIAYHNFLEVFAFDAARADAAFGHGLKLSRQLIELGLPHFSITPHAPYSASVQLLNKIADFAWQNNSILSIHNQESEDENLLFLNKIGKILERLNHFGINTANWQATGKSSLQSTLIHLPRNLSLQLVHNTFTTAADAEFADEYNQQVYWCFCPNANLYIEEKLPAFDIFTDHSHRLTLGTDSYASNKSLSVMDEINTILKHAPHLKLEALLKWASINGAKFLGMDEQLGSFEKGKKPGGVLITENNNKLVSERVF